MNLFITALLLLAQAQPSLKILVIEGADATNYIQLGTGRTPIVEIRDENDRLVSGAKVTFSLPDRGPSGAFFGAGTSLSVSTDQQGRAAGRGLRPNDVEGRFQIHVTAEKENRTASLNIPQRNVLSQDTASKPKKKFGKGKLIGALAVAGIIAAVVATHGGDDNPSTATPGTTITPGTISVGTPR